jgi:hypothetical protein
VSQQPELDCGSDRDHEWDRLAAMSADQFQVFDSR